MALDEQLSDELNGVINAFIRSRQGKPAFNTLVTVLTAMIRTLLYVVHYVERHDLKHAERFREELCSHLIDFLIYDQEPHSE